MEHIRPFEMARKRSFHNERNFNEWRLLQAYLSMYHTADRLFSKAWDMELSEEEVNDYNFIVSVLGIRDKFLSYHMHYRWLRSIIPVYKKEGPCSLAFHTTFMPYKVFTPWVCSDFLQNTEYAQELLNINPGAKQMMREHAMRTLKFECNFSWSDSSDEEYEEEHEHVVCIGPHPAYEEEPVSSSSTTIYVEKTPEELYGDMEWAEQLLRLSKAEPLGGLKVPNYYL